MTPTRIDSATCATLDDVTLDHTVKAYAREERDLVENAEALAYWLRCLRKAGVPDDCITSECTQYSSEAHFTVTLREAYHLMAQGWDACFPTDVDDYLLEHVLGKARFAYEPHRKARRADFDAVYAMHARLEAQYAAERRHQRRAKHRSTP